MISYLLSKYSYILYGSNQLLQYFWVNIINFSQNVPVLDYELIPVVHYKATGYSLFKIILLSYNLQILFIWKKKKDILREMTELRRKKINSVYYYY